MNKTITRYYVFNETRMCFLSLGVTTARTHFSRLRGLLGRMRLLRDDGLWVIPSHGVHTIGLLFPIDLIYLDAERRVVHLVEHLGPFRIAAFCLESASVLELPARTIFGTGTKAGDQLIIASPEEMSEYWNPPRAGSPASVLEDISPVPSSD